MSTPHPLQIVRYWADRWRTLAAWCAELPAIVTVEMYAGQRLLGRATYATRHAMVRVTGDLAEDLGTALHELAHLAAPVGTRHSKRWRVLYARAAAEAFGLGSAEEIDPSVQIRDLDMQITDLAREWIRAGHHLAMRATEDS